MTSFTIEQQDGLKMENIIKNVTTIAKIQNITFGHALLIKRERLGYLIDDSNGDKDAIKYYQTKMNIIDIMIRKELDTKYWPNNLFMGTFAEVEA
jgi:hypothetical protein